MTTRRKLLKTGVVAASAAFAMPALVRRAWAEEKVTMVTPFGFDPMFLDMMNAVSGGHFAKAGLDATLVGAPSTAQEFEQILAGQGQFAMISGIDFMRAVVGKGAPWQAIAVVSQNQGFHLVSLAAKPITDGAALKGKTIGLLNFGGTAETVMNLILAKFGVARGDVNLVVAGNSPGEVELIRQGRLDGFICNFGVVFTLRKMAAPVVMVSLDSLVPNPGQVYFTPRALIASRPDFVRQVLGALKASVVEIVAGPIAPIYERAAKQFEIPGIKDLPNLTAMMQQVVDQMWLAQGRQNLMRNMPERWQSAVAAMQDIKVIGPVDPKTLYTNQFIDAV